MQSNLFRFLLAGCLASLLVSCEKEKKAGEQLPFESTPASAMLSPVVEEISGIAQSQQMKPNLWAQEDSGTPNQLYLINPSGVVLKKVHLKGIINRDWEDMAVVNGRIYIAETGDNTQSYPSYAFYMFNEPATNTDTVKLIDTLRFTYPDGSHDSEAFLVDPQSKDVFVITKRDTKSKIYRLGYPYSSPATASLVGELPYTGVVCAALSADGREIIIKTYSNIYYYKRADGTTLPAALNGAYNDLPYTLEPQGEAVCFAVDGGGFYTISEKAFSPSVSLYFYKRR